MSPLELKEIDAHIILGNTFPFVVASGLDVIGKFGGLHDFMGWDKPILTDSGASKYFTRRDAQDYRRGREVCVTD